MKKKLKLVLSYDGSDFKGWAVQPGKRTVEGILKDSLLKIFSGFSDFYVGGRTDAGVHALGQVISLETELSSNFKESGILKALNSTLPSDIRVNSVEFMDPNFNARYNAVKRSYIYYLRQQNLYRVFDRNYYTYFNQPVKLQIMKRAAKVLCGEHNFKGFSSSSTDSKSFIREVYSVKFSGSKQDFSFEISANGFLTHMIRLIMGTLIEIGTGQLNPEQVNRILKEKKRGLTGKKLSPHGLFLQRIEYEV